MAKSKSVTTREASNPLPVSVLNVNGSEYSLKDALARQMVEPLLFAQFYPEGNVKSAAEFTAGIKYDAPDTVNRTITVKPFCNTGDTANDNSDLGGRVVIPPFVDAQGNPYISDDDTRYKVVGVNGAIPEGTNTNLTAIIAPSTVTSIGDVAFAGCSALTSVSLPSAQTVGGGAFGICSSLTSVYLPVAVTISKEAFYSCTSLTSISLPSAQTVGESAFYSCTSLTSISLPSAQTVGESAFSYCTSLTSISLPSAQTVGESAFSYCDALAFISLPAATTIGVGSFNSCDALTIVSLPAATSIGDRAFGGCAALASVSLPATTNIGDRAFGICSSLTSISLPSAQTVGESAFSYCTSLDSADFGATPRSSVPTLTLDAFNGVPTTCKIIVPYTQYDAWIAADGWKDLPQEFVRHAEKADKPTSFTEGNLAKFDANGNPADSGKSPSDFLEGITIFDYDAVTWQDIIDAYDKQGMVYVRVPVSGATGSYRYGSLTYLLDRRSDPTKTDAKAEFLYYRTTNKSGSSSSNFEDEAWVYTIVEHPDRTTTTNGWRTEKRPILNAFPDWAKNTAYTTDSVVLRNNILYRCTVAHTSGSTWDSSKWATTTLPAIIANCQRYLLVTKTPTVSSGTASITLDDRTCNVSSTTSAIVELTFPAAISGYARDFLLLLDTTGSSSAPTLAYASYMTIVADEDMDLTPEVGLNLYTFTEVAANTFAATRTTLVTIAERVPQDGQSLMNAASQAGYDMSNVSTPGQLATALGLSASADLEDCVNKVMFG